MVGWANQTKRDMSDVYDRYNGVASGGRTWIDSMWG